MPDGASSVTIAAGSADCPEIMKAICTPRDNGVWKNALTSTRPVAGFGITRRRAI
jgi:hypothetical protein